MVTGRPRLEQIGRGTDDALARASHAFDDAGREVDEDRGIVDAALAVQRRRRRRDGGVEARRIDGHAVPRARLRVSVSLERRSWMYERKVDVEEDGARSRHEPASPALEGSNRGPAIAAHARPGSSTAPAAAFTSSRVTARSRSGSRRS